MKVYICDNKNCKKQLNKKDMIKVKINGVKYHLCRSCERLLKEVIQEKLRMTEDDLIEDASVKIENKSIKGLSVERRINEIGIDKVIEMFRSGESLDSISASINIPRSSLSSWAQKNNIQRNTAGKRRAALLIDEYGIENIKDKYLNKGYTTAKLAEEIGVSVSYLTLVLNKNGIHKRGMKNTIEKSYNTIEQQKIIDKKQENALTNYNNKKSIFKNTVDSKAPKRQNNKKQFNIGSKILGDKQIKILSACEEKAKVSAACRDCLYRELEINHCWYKMVTNKENYIHEEICDHFVDRNKHEEKLKDIN